MIDWEQKLNDHSENWHLRLQYATYLEEEDRLEECKAQRWMADNMKCPGPPCVQEAFAREATWFVEGSKSWGFPYFVSAKEIDPKWCLSRDVFNELKNFIINRRDGGFHNRWAKSWNSREEAELALANALNTTAKYSKRKFRSIEDDWKPSFR